MEDAPGGPEQELAFGAGDAGIDQFPGENRIVVFRQGHQDIGKAGALGFVDGHGEDQLMRRQLLGKVKMHLTVYSLCFMG